MNSLCEHLACSALLPCYKCLKISPQLKLKSTLLQHVQSKHVVFSPVGANISTPTKNKAKPFVIMLPWLGSTERAVFKYVQLYKSIGCNVVVNYSNLSDFLWPKTGLANSRKFLIELKKSIGDQDCPIIIHSASIGCYFYALILMQLEKEPEMFGAIKNSIKVQILDSPVVGTLHQMAIGTATVSTSQKMTQGILKAMILSYFALTKPFTVSIYNKGIDTIKYNSPIVPSLIMSSTGDPMALPEKVNELIQIWEKREIKLTSKVWEDSVHAQHLKYHSNEYISLIRSILQDSLPHNIAISSKL